MLEKLRKARVLLEVAIHTKQETRRLGGHIDRLRYGADQGLEVTEAIGHAVQGEFGLGDTWTLGLTAFNWAPKIDPSLRRKKPWSWREG